MGVRGFEPRTSALSELRSNQLSYTPLPHLSEVRAIVAILSNGVNLVFLNAEHCFGIRSADFGMPKTILQPFRHTNSRLGSLTGGTRAK